MPNFETNYISVKICTGMNVIDSLAFLWSKEYRKFTHQICHLWKAGKNETKGNFNPETA